jgi:glutamine cyclotransferase
MTHDSTHLYISNGSSTIFIVDPFSFTVVGSINVRDSYGNQIVYLNELEMVNDTYIYANKFTTNYIYKIEKSTGKVLNGWNMYNLWLTQYYALTYTQRRYYDWSNNVLNGIAYRKESNTFMLTGKMWDFVFDVALVG